MFNSKAIRHFPCLMMALVFFLLIASTRVILSAYPSTQMSIALTLDFVFTIPILYAWAIWKTKIPRFTILSVGVLSICLASLIFPLEHRIFLDQLKLYLIPLFEILVFGFIAYKGVKLRNKVIELGGKMDFYALLKQASLDLFPSRIALLLSTEIAVIYYVFNFKKAPEIGKHQFSYYKTSGIKMTVGAILMLILIELGVMHIFIHNWNPKIAWLITFISFYGFLQILALLKSMPYRLIEFVEETNELILRHGIYSEMTLPLSQILEVEYTRKSYAEDKSLLDLSPFNLLDSHNVIIRFKEELILQSFYGIQRKGSGIKIYIDELDKFKILFSDLSLK